MKKIGIPANLFRLIPFKNTKACISLKYNNMIGMAWWTAGAEGTADVTGRLTLWKRRALRYG